MERIGLDIEAQTKRLGYTVDGLLAELLKVIVRDCLEQINGSIKRLSVGKTGLENLPFKIRFTIPQMWSAAAKQRMQNAAIAAGLPFVALASEPHAVLAHLIYAVNRDRLELGCHLRIGDYILVVDAGAGTGDFVLYRLIDDLSEHSRLEAVHQSSGLLCGSQRVNEFIYTLFIFNGKEVKECGGLQAVLDKHKLSRRAFRKRVLRQIEVAKCKTTQSARHLCAIEGGPGAPDFYFVITK